MSAIKYFSTQTPGIGGSIKRRIVDFRVQEITPEGEICALESFDDRQKIRLDKGWPEEEKDKEHLKLTLEKYNTDLNQAVKLIARGLGKSRKRIGYAGLKDKRALTAQKISIWKPDYARLQQMDFRYFDLRDAAWVKERVEIGHLKGNAFEITIRKIELDREEVEKRVAGCFREMEKGILNYFGGQRFGGIRNISHKVGKEFVKGNIGKGVMLYLTALSPKEAEDITAARKHLAETLDFKAASREFPLKYRYERGMIQHLHNAPGDYVGAFRILPKSMRYLFTHAYQSYLFNQVINKRVEAGIGTGKTEGDILEYGIPTAPLIGFRSEFAEGLPGKLEKEVLEAEGIQPKQFMNREMPELSSKGTRKKLALFPEQLKLHGVEEDEFNPGMRKCTLSFRLDKGNYATSVLREIMKTELD